MTGDALRKLSFGVRKTKHSDTVKKEADKDAELRQRNAPENLIVSIRELRQKLKENVTNDEMHEEDTPDEKPVEGVKLFQDRELVWTDKSINGQKPKSEKKASNEVAVKLATKLAELRRLNRIYLWGENIPEPIIEFQDAGIPVELQSTLEANNIKEPTPIQMQSIPLMTQKRDLLCSAPTGSGKTLAFAIPAILDVLRLKKLKKYSKGNPIFAIVLEPTKELANQTYRQFLKYSSNLNCKCTLLEDKDSLADADIVVSTPSRLIYSLEKLHLDSLRWLIVDESDRLFDTTEGHDKCFRNQLATIFKACNGKFTKRAFFSATFSSAVEQWCKSSLNDVAMICIGARNSSNTNVTQELVFAGSEYGKVVAIKNLLRSGFDAPALIFVQSKERARELVSAISEINPPIPTGFISSEKDEAERKSTLEKFRAGKIFALVCTELVGRGLDFKNVNLVVNFDLPTTIVSYIHRIGRTGRAGRNGRAITYFTEADTDFLRPIATIISQAGFDVPQYTLNLKHVSRNDKRNLMRKAPLRKHIARIPHKRRHKEEFNAATRVDKTNGEIVNKNKKIKKLNV